VCKGNRIVRGENEEQYSLLAANSSEERERLFDDEGALRRFVNVFVADDDVRYLDGVDTAVAEGGEISIIPAVAGG
jgi:molybdopterin converting factor small subunit